MQRMNVPLWKVMAMAVAWEVIEPHLKAAFPKAFPTPSPDPDINAVGDIGTTLLGYELSRRLRDK